MNHDELTLKLEQVRGEIKNLETVIRMSISEQKSLNFKYESNAEQTAERMGRVENKLWWIQGLLGSTGVALVITIFKLLMLKQ